MKPMDHGFTLDELMKNADLSVMLLLVVGFGETISEPKRGIWAVVIGPIRWPRWAGPISVAYTAQTIL
jgi:hypothetical protein